MVERTSGRVTEREVVVDDDDVDLGLPDRKYFKIGEVAGLLSVEPHVLRYWETQFPQLKPHKARSGHRLYRRREVETLLVIKDLLHVQRFTIAGARQALRQQGTTSLLPRAAEQLTLPPAPAVTARHTRVLESTIPTDVDDVDGDADLDEALLDGEEDGDVDVDGDDEDVLELHLADPLPRQGEVEVEIVAADGEALAEAMAREVTRQMHPRSTISAVEVRASAGARPGARSALMIARDELEAFLARHRRPTAPDNGRTRH